MPGGLSNAIVGAMLALAVNPVAGKTVVVAIFAENAIVEERHGFTGVK